MTHDEAKQELMKLNHLSDYLEMAFELSKFNSNGVKLISKYMELERSVLTSVKFQFNLRIPETKESKSTSLKLVM